ncbi:alanine dehydrogenase [candidate division KSB1 bacterium]
MNQNSDRLMNFSDGGKLLPKEEMLETAKQKSSLMIAVPKETSYQENRVSLCPSMVGVLVQNGHTVLIENNAGKSAHFHDHDYSEAGGQIVYNKEELFKADIILKVAPLSLKEIELMKNRQTLISALHFTDREIKYFKKLSDKKVTAIAFELIKDRTNSFPIIKSLSEIVGNTVILIAAEYLGSSKYGKGTMVGGVSGVTPTEVVILGAGTVGEYAAKAALGLGAVVKVFDNKVFKLRRLQNCLNTRVFSSIIEPNVLTKALKQADVVIGAMHAEEGSIHYMVSEDMVRQMKEGSVIIDVSIDQGGCFETSKVTNHLDPVYKRFGVTHYCVPNISSKVPHTASYALSNYFAPIILGIGEEGGIINMLKTDYGVRQGVYLFSGIISKKFIAEYYGLPYQDLELLMAAYKAT